MNSLNQFAANLQAHRRRLDLTQEALGEVCSMHRTEIGLLERSERNPRFDTIVKLARGLEITPAELLADVR